jgi:hypothetical protein
MLINVQFKSAAMEEPKKVPESERERGEGGGVKAGREGAVGVAKFVSEGLYYMEEDDENEGSAADWMTHSLKYECSLSVP